MSYTAGPLWYLQFNWSKGLNCTTRSISICIQMWLQNRKDLACRTTCTIKLANLIHLWWVHSNNKSNLQARRMDFNRVDKLLYVRINIHVLMYTIIIILRISSMWFILLCLLAVELPQKRNQHLVRWICYHPAHNRGIQHSVTLLRCQVVSRAVQ